jgi:hypothetical protein
MEREPHANRANLGERDAHSQGPEAEVLATLFHLPIYASTAYTFEVLGCTKGL